MSESLQMLALGGFPLVRPGDDLAALVDACLQHNGLSLQSGDVLVMAQKVISKAEGRYVRLAEVVPSPRALELAERAGKDARQVELVLRESREVLRVRPGVIIVEHRNGYVLANAGIDKSNIDNSKADPQVLLLPVDADRSAERLRRDLAARCGVRPQVIINDSVGRAWRNGTVGIAIGTAGLQPTRNQVGEEDLFGNVLEVTEPAVADELAAAASVMMGQAAEGRPVVLVRGLDLPVVECGSGGLLRERHLDMFR